MLLSLTRVGATRQGLRKGIAVLGADPGRLEHAVDPGVARPVTGTAGLFQLRASRAWLGTASARDETFAAMAQDARRLADAARLVGGIAIPTAIGLAGQSAVLGGDMHVIEVLSAVEQEVLANLLRTHVPTLIAMTGRPLTASGMPPDRVGSRWLAGSRTHLAARYLASTEPEHLERVKAELRRHDGVSRLDRLDIFPASTGADSTLVVVVRCVDAAPSLAAARAHALVLAALGLRARRMVRDGNRVGNPWQRTLEENRARAIAEGLRAQFAPVEDWGRNRNRNRDPARPDGAHGQAGPPRPPRMVGAREAIRRLLKDLCTEFSNLEATPEELAPVIMPVELPQLGLRRVAGESDLLTTWSRQGDQVLARAAWDAFLDSAPGGPTLAAARGTAPGRVSIVLDTWRSLIADPGLAKGRGRGGPAGDRGQRDPGRHGQGRGGGGRGAPGPSRPGRRDGQQAGRG